jgi:nicotinamide-nucleotide amidase
MSLKIAVLTIGDELLNGEMHDTNTAGIARLLDHHGLAISESLTVGDAEEDIENALRDLSSRRDVVIVTGGLGPTADDVTARAAARAFGRRLVLHEEALARIRDFFRRAGTPMHPRNEKQALLPQKVAILPNEQGTAPGFLLQQGEKDLFFLPGVPEEMAPMLEKIVLPQLRQRHGGHFSRQERVIKVFGLSEPKTEELLTAAHLPDGVEMAFGVDFPIVHVKLRASGAAAETLLDRAELIARRALGDFVVALGSDTLPEVVARMLTTADLTLALAESCTGGLISATLTDIPGASAFLDRCAVTYANRAKEEWLGVSASLLAEYGAVSDRCALAMAQGIRRAAGTDLALAVTGIAGPDGGTPEKPVGTVYIALAATDEMKVNGYRFAGDRQRVRRMAAFMALEWLRRYLYGQRG